MDYCREIVDSYNSLCVIHGATESNDFGYRFSPELTEKLKGDWILATANHPQKGGRMITNDEIAKLAREYAEEATKADADDPNLSASDLNGIKRDVAEYAEQVISWLLRTHCIVSKEKVRKLHNNELEFAQFYQQKANSCCNQQCRRDYETARDIAKSRAKLLESLFDAETFKNSEV